MDENLQNLLGKVTQMEQVETKSKRPYTVIAKKGDRKLMFNADFLPNAFKAKPVSGGEQSKEYPTVALVLRFMENGKEPVFTCFASRAEEHQVDDGFYRHQPVVLPFCLIGPGVPGEYVRLKWEQQEVAKKVTEWIEAKLKKLGVDLCVPTDALESLVSGPVDMNTTGLKFFKLPG